jgi:hypothetical protein
MSSNLISEYLGRGLVGDRPNPPDVPAGVLATYFATDTGVFSVWTGSAWQNIIPSGALTIVQHKVVAQSNLATGITLDAAPAAGNLLFALVMRNALTVPAAGTGWTIFDSNSATSSAHAFAWKAAVVGEPALQTPTSTSAANGAIAIWEVSGVRSIDVTTFAAATSTGINNTQTLVRSRTAFILGAAWGVLGEEPTGLSGTVSAVLPFSAPTVIGGTTFQGTPNTLGSTTYNAQATFPSSQVNRNVFTIIT